jgi:universal stress protein A
MNIMHYNHILCAIGLGDHTVDLLQQAANMAQRTQAKLSVVHVMEHTPVIYGEGELSIPLDINLEEQLTQIAEQMLAKYSEAVSVQPENQYIEHGSIKTKVVELAQHLSVDLIVVGRHEAHGAQLLLGSTANAILHASKCDVLAVQPTLK